MRASPQATLYWVVTITILLYAIYLRLGYLDIIEFKSDEFEWIKLAYQHIHDKPTLVGLPSSVGLYHPPFFAYLLSIPISISTDPKFVTGFVALLNLTGLWLLYIFAKRVFSLRLAWVVVSLVATSPWAILYSRKVWNPDCLLPFMLVFYITLASYLERPTGFKVWIMAALLALITQLHMSAWFLFGPLFVFAALVKAPLSIRDVLIGGLLFALLYTPYITFHVLTDFQNLNLFSSFERPTIFSQSNLASAIDNIKWTYVISSGTGLSYSLGNEFDTFYRTRYLTLPYVFFSIVLFVAAFGTIRYLVLSVRWVFQRREWLDTPSSTKILILFTLILFLMHLAYFLFKVPSLPHYNVIFYPILFIIAAKVGVDAYKKASSHYIKRVLLGLLLAILCSNLYVTHSMFDYLKRNPVGNYGDYGNPYFANQDDWRQRINSFSIE